jgi:hypothetical protein
MMVTFSDGAVKAQVIEIRPDQVVERSGDA